jgi:outer membrane biosynthesis protein TonB
MKKLIFIGSILLIASFSRPGNAFAHPGRTASDGCHYCRTNCDSWGVPWDERHCHGGSVAPAPQADPPPPPPPTFKIAPTTSVKPAPTPAPAAQSTPEPSSQPDSENEPEGEIQGESLDTPDIITEGSKQEDVLVSATADSDNNDSGPAAIGALTLAGITGGGVYWYYKRKRS